MNVVDRSEIFISSASKVVQSKTFGGKNSPKYSEVLPKFKSIPSIPSRSIAPPEDKLAA